MKKLLYIDACVNRDISRTERLAQALLKEMNKNRESEAFYRKRECRTGTAHEGRNL